MKTSFWGLTFLLLSFFTAAQYNTAAANIDLKIDRVVMGKMQGDKAPSEFSIKISLTNHGADISNWSLGFFMAGTPFTQFIKGSQSFNPKLIRRICNSKHHCVPLQYDKASSVEDIDLSQGYTTIHTPAKEFALESGETYTVELLHINQWGGGNVSYFPQNFFILRSSEDLTESRSTHLEPLDTNFSTYSVVGYDQSQTDSEIKSHVTEKWSQSKPLEGKLDLTLVPLPVKVEMKTGVLHVHDGTLEVVSYFKKDMTKLEGALNTINPQMSIDIFNAIPGEHKKAIVELSPLTHPEKINNNPEGYIIDVSEDKIVISAVNEAGVYYAFQTLSQLCENDRNSSGDCRLSQLKITDYPRFPYRGVMLDTARHFFSVEEIKRFIDLIAANKLNTLHIHFSDDEAFRLEIPSLPEIGKRANTRKFGASIGPMMFPQGNLYDSYKNENFTRPNDTYSGTYSPQDIAELIKYANERQVTIIPEIDLPAHARALIKAMPEVFVDPNDQSQYLSVQGYWDDVVPVCTYNSDISVGREFTKATNTIINYIRSAFSNQDTVYYLPNEVSIAGDEVSPDAWTNTTSCKGAWAGLNSVGKSHKFFTELSVSNPEVKLSGWQQLVQGESAELGVEAINSDKVGHIWVWDNSEPGVYQATELINRDYPTVLAFANKTYFDLVYTPDIRETGFAWASKWSDTEAALSSAISANMVEDLTDYSSNLVGIEGALWSEHLASFEQLIYMALPKMSGLAEASWSPRARSSSDQKVNWQSLATRLGCGESGFLSYLNKQYGVEYRGYPHGIHLEVPEQVCVR